MSSGQNNKLEEVRKFLSAILSGELSGYKIKQQNDELFQITNWSQNQQLITGATFKPVSDQVIMIDYSTVQVTPKGKQVLAEAGGEIPAAKTAPTPENPKVVPLKAQNQNDPAVAAMIQPMTPEDQKTAEDLLAALKAGQSDQLVYRNYLSFFDRNPQFYNYFINADKAQTQPTPQPAANSDSGTIFSPEVQKIIANTQQKAPTAATSPATPNRATQPAPDPEAATTKATAATPNSTASSSRKTAPISTNRASTKAPEPATSVNATMTQTPQLQVANAAAEPQATGQNPDLATQPQSTPDVQAAASRLTAVKDATSTAATTSQPASEAPKAEQPTAAEPTPAKPNPTATATSQPAQATTATNTPANSANHNVSPATAAASRAQAAVATANQATSPQPAAASESAATAANTGASAEPAAATAPMGHKRSSHVQIRYVDQENEEIAPTLMIQLTSQTAAYDVTNYQKQIHDYNFVKADHAQGRLTGEDLTVTFHYEAKIARGSIRVNYVDQQGDDIAEEKIVQGGHIKEFYPLLDDLPESLITLIKARRYQLRSILADNDPTDSSLIYFSDLDQNFTAIFQELLPGRITLRYRNRRREEIGIGKRIMENDVHNGDQIAIPLPLVPTGYELDQTLLNGDPVRVGDQFTVTPEPQIIDYVFKRVIADGAIIFNYVDQDGRQIARQTTVRGGRYGEVYDFNGNLPQAILNRVNEGIYESNPIVKEESENGTVVPANRIVFDNQDQEYSAVFQATEAAKITLKFVTTDDNPIPDVEDKVVQGTHYYGDTFVIPSAPAITGFDLNRIMVNDKAAKIDDPVMYSNQEQTITYVYTIATSTITAHHVDQLGRQIAEDRVITGQIGTTVEQSKLVSLRVNPYFVLSDVLTSNNNYTFSADPQFITFHYQVDDNLVPEVLNTADVVLMNCLDTDGNIIGKVTPSALRLDQVKVGHVYSVHAPDFAGYHLFSKNDTVRVVWNSEKANDFIIVNHPNGLAFIYQAI